MNGFVAYDENKEGPRPAVIIIPEWWGLNDFVKHESENMRSTILGGIFHLKKKKVDKILKSILGEIQRETDENNQTILMQRYMRIKEVEKGISSFLGSVVVK